jgi:PAS domain S-box-containing protein
MRERDLGALRESDSRYREVFENTNSGVAVFAATDDGGDFIIRAFNRAAEGIEGVSRERVIGRLVTDAFPGIRAFGLLDVLQRVWKTGQAEHPTHASPTRTSST